MMMYEFSFSGGGVIRLGGSMKAWIESRVQGTRQTGAKEGTGNDRWGGGVDKKTHLKKEFSRAGRKSNETEETKAAKESPLDLLFN